jgi:hypothetical protein
MNQLLMKEVDEFFDRKGQNPCDAINTIQTFYQ